MSTKAISSFEGVSFALSRDEPSIILQQVAQRQHIPKDSGDFAEFMDQHDPLKDFRQEFIIPKSKETSSADIDIAYLAGNATGLQMKQAKSAVLEVIDSWSEKSSLCHFEHPLPAATCDDYITEQMAKVVGAKECEVAAMNGIDVNLNLMMVSFYRPNPQRNKILTEEKHYGKIANCHIKQHGYNAVESLMTLRYRPGKHVFREEDMIETINSKGSSITTILLPGVLATSGQLLDIEAITKAGHDQGCMVGFDLSNAVGNVELKLNEWGVDFACWGTDKYLNGGVGSIAFAFIHEKHTWNQFPKFLGWWGHEYASRFEMTNEMNLSPGVKGYRISNQSPVVVAPVKASLDLFDRTSMMQLREKSFLITGYLEYLIKKFFPKPTIQNQKDIGIDIITPCSFFKTGIPVIVAIHERYGKGICGIEETRDHMSSN